MEVITDGVLERKQEFSPNLDTASRSRSRDYSYVTLAYPVSDFASEDLTPFSLPRHPELFERGSFGSGNSSKNERGKGRSGSIDGVDRIPVTSGTWASLKNSVASVFQRNVPDILDTSVCMSKSTMRLYYEGAWYGQLITVQEFLAAGFDINRVGEDMQKKTMLHLASYMGRLNVVEYLVQHNADVNLKDAEGRTALNCACWGGRQEVADFLASRTNSHVTFDIAASAARIGSLETVKRWYLNLNNSSSEPKANIEEALCTPNVEGQNLLHIACDNEHTKIAIFLIEGGFAKKALYQMDDDGLTAVDIMIQKGLIHVMHEVMRIKLKEYGFVSHRQIRDWFIELSKSYCQLSDLGSVFFLPMLLFYQYGKLLPFEELTSVLVPGVSLEENSHVLYISHNFGTQQLEHLYSLITSVLQLEDREYDYIWINNCCLCSTSKPHIDVQKQLSSIPLAMFFATDVLVLPGLVKEKKAGLEYLDILAYSLCMASQADLVMAGLIGTPLHFGFYGTKLSTQCCGMSLLSRVKNTMTHEEGGYMQSIFVFETEHRSRVFEEYAAACCKEVLKKTADKRTYKKLSNKLMPSKQNDFEYIEPSDLLSGITKALLSSNPETIVKLCARELDLKDSQGNISVELQSCYSLFEHSPNNRPELQTRSCSSIHGKKDGAYSCPCTSSCFLNLASLVYHIMFLIQKNFKSYELFLQTLPTRISNKPLITYEGIPDEKKEKDS